MQLTFVHKIAWVFNVILMLRASFPIEVTAVSTVAAQHSEARISREDFALYSPGRFIAPTLQFYCSIRGNFELAVYLLFTYFLQT